MNYNKKTVKDIDVAGKKVLLRCDFNVPQDKATGAITDDSRIVASLPTIRYLLEQKAAVIACSHLGKPKGEWKESLSLAPVAVRLRELLGCEVIFCRDVVGEIAKNEAAALKPGQLMLLENLRFDTGEEANNPVFTKKLCDMAQVFVSDAFGSTHRAHASTFGAAAFLPAVSGFLIQKELEIMGSALEHPKHPFVAILGGAKVSDKIGVINSLLEKVDIILLGGGMAYTFLKAQGGSIGNSLCEDDKLDYAREMMEKARKKGITFLLPIDNLAAREFTREAEPMEVDSMNIPEGFMGLDIGTKTVAAFTEALRGAGTVIWNGPMGVFEFPAFSGGTKAVAKALAELPDAVTIVGGGDSAAAVEQLGFADRITHTSTGGGASLKFLEGKDLPGVSCLLDQ